MLGKLLVFALVLTIVTFTASAQKQLWSLDNPARFVNGVPTYYYNTMSTAFVGQSGDALVSYDAISGSGASAVGSQEIMWITSKGQRAATLRLAPGTFVSGVLNMSASEVTVALTSTSKNFIQTYRRNGARLQVIRTLEHGSSNFKVPGMGMQVIPDGRGFPNGFVGIRQDGKGGLRFIGYGY